MKGLEKTTKCKSCGFLIYPLENFGGFCRDCYDQSVRENGVAMSTPIHTLECCHCGDDAIESKDGLFGQDEGDACMTCGFPGHVDVDEGTEDDNGIASWSITDDPEAICNRDDCDECRLIECKRLRKIVDGCGQQPSCTQLPIPWESCPRIDSLRAEVARLRGALTMALGVICGEFCGNTHHPICEQFGDDRAAINKATSQDTPATGKANPRCSSRQHGDGKQR